MDKMIKHFDINKSGRDFVVGDIHGCFEMLKQSLFDIKFDSNIDRLFSVGDMVDRGHKSEDCIKWIDKPWFHAVRGNHEQMAIDTFYGEWDAGNYMGNGGAWFLGLSTEEQRCYVEAFEQLPLIIEVETESGLQGIVHAEYPTDNWIDKDSGIKDTVRGMAFKNVCLWSRGRFKNKDDSIIEGVNHVFVGHTPVNNPIMLGNTVYIDTGDVFKRKLTVIQINK